MLKVTLCLSILSAACAGPSRAPAGPASSGRPAAGQAVPAVAPISSSPVEISPAQALKALFGAKTEDLGPSILLPRRARAGTATNPSGGADQTGSDEEIARVSDLVLRRSDLVERMMEAEPIYVRQWIEYLIMDVLVAEQATQHGIQVDVAAVDARLDAELAALRTRIAAELSGVVLFEQYTERQFGMSPEEYRNWQRMSFARDWYRQYVVRFLALREDRVQVRVLSTTDLNIAKDAEQRLRDGADFATLARRHSDDESRKDGGLLAPMRRSATHPVVAAAFDLDVGQISKVLTFERDGVVRHYVVLCMQKFQGRQVPFADVRAEIDLDIERRPLPPSEFEAAFQQLLEQGR